MSIQDQLNRLRTSLNSNTPTNYNDVPHPQQAYSQMPRPTVATVARLPSVQPSFGLGFFVQYWKYFVVLIVIACVVVIVIKRRKNKKKLEQSNNFNPPLMMPNQPSMMANSRFQEGNIGLSNPQNPQNHQNPVNPVPRFQNSNSDPNFTVV